jgi:maltose O-acetyltransferase
MVSNMKEKLVRGEWIPARFDKELNKETNRAYSLCQKLCRIEMDSAEYLKTLKGLLGDIGEGTFIRAPIFVDFGYNIHIGKDSFVNYNCVFLDENSITIGNNAWIGPGVHIYAVEHGKEINKRDWERGVPVTIGDNVWIGGHATILPGVHLKDGCLVGAGAVVTKDVEPGTTVVGNPAKSLK